jgi:hypothetical protein
MTPVFVSQDLTPVFVSLQDLTPVFIGVIKLAAHPFRKINFIRHVVIVLRVVGRCIHDVTLDHSPSTYFS